jgi:hypothetical protein
MQQPEELGIDWTGWVSASSTHNSSEQDQLVDWLNFHGEDAGFVPDSQRPDHDPRFSYVSNVLRQSHAFERAVVKLLSNVTTVRQIGHGPMDARNLARRRETEMAMRAGVYIIAQGVLWDPEARTDAMPDLLIRSDVLARLYPAAFDGEPAGAASVPAPGICNRDEPYHYRAVDIKFTTLELTQDGEASHKHLPYMVQNWIYNQALGKTQGYRPPASYLLGRDYFKSLARVSHQNPELRRLAQEGAAWIRRVKEEGASWHPIPSPTIPELRPNMKAWADLDWHRAKQEIAEAQHDLTLLPYVNPKRRARAAARGITRWDDPALSAEVLGLADTLQGRRIDAVLAANRPPAKSPVVPETILTNVGDWRTPDPADCFVVVQRVTDQMDDFSRLPERGGVEMVFIVNWGWHDPAGQWHTGQLVAQDLSGQAESALSEAWKIELEQIAKSAGVRLDDLRLYHWGSTRLLLPQMSWRDILLELILEEPIAVRGSFGFSLEELAKALHASRLIESEVPPLPPGPLAATAGAWWSAKEAERLGIPLSQVDVIQKIGAYGEASCRSMMEILVFLRECASASIPEAA